MSARELEPDELPAALPTEVRVLQASKMAYGAYAGLMIIGSLLLFAGSFFALLEATTRPRVRSSTAIGIMVSIGVVLGHLWFETARARGVSRWRWALFFFGVVWVAVEMLVTPDLSWESALVISVPLVVGATYVAVARLLIAPHAATFARLPLLMRLGVVAVVWGMPAAGLAALSWP